MRPAVCLTNSIGAYRHVVIAFITSQVAKANEPTDVLLTEIDANFRDTGLKVSSAVRLHRLVTIPTRVIKRQLGKIPTDHQREIEQKIKKLFEL